MAGVLVNPRSYSNSYYNIYVTAESAANYIDYNGIVSAADNVLNVAREAVNDIAKKLRNVQIGQEALTVGDKTMEPVIEEVSQIISTLADGLEPTLENIKDTALQKYNEKQNELNNIAYENYKNKLDNAEEAEKARKNS